MEQIKQAVASIVEQETKALREQLRAVEERNHKLAVVINRIRGVLLAPLAKLEDLPKLVEHAQANQADLDKIAEALGTKSYDHGKLHEQVKEWLTQWRGYLNAVCEVAGEHFYPSLGKKVAELKARAEAKPGSAFEAKVREAMGCREMSEESLFERLKGMDAAVKAVANTLDRPGILLQNLPVAVQDLKTTAKLRGERLDRAETQLRDLANAMNCPAMDSAGLAAEAKRLKACEDEANAFARVVAHVRGAVNYHEHMDGLANAVKAAITKPEGTDPRVDKLVKALRQWSRGYELSSALKDVGL
jgi:hypothetical protein